VNLFWIDIETSGLDETNGEILEVAWLVTNPNLEVITGNQALVSHKDVESIANNSHQIVQRMHLESGLWEDLVSEKPGMLKMGYKELSERIIADIKGHSCYVPDQYKSPWCGSSVDFDRRWIGRFMPAIGKHLAYRVIDVSTITELFSRWYDCDLAKSTPAGHRAMADITRSLNLLRVYRERYFR
jgi:oligoribonuclease